MTYYNSFCSCFFQCFSYCSTVTYLKPGVANGFQLVLQLKHFFYYLLLLLLPLHLKQIILSYHINLNSKSMYANTMSISTFKNIKEDNIITSSIQYTKV